jgi:hypothetical protein
MTKDLFANQWKQIRSEAKAWWSKIIIEERNLQMRKPISADESKRIGECLHIDWEQVDPEQFRQGLMGNPQQGSSNHKS